MPQRNKKFGGWGKHWRMESFYNDLISNILYYKVRKLFISHLKIFFVAQEIKSFTNLKFIFLWHWLFIC